MVDTRLMTDIIAEMTRIPEEGEATVKPWSLHYIPPKNLRVPGYDYRRAEDTSEKEAGSIREQIFKQKAYGEKQKVGNDATFEDVSQDSLRHPSKPMLVSSNCGLSYRKGSSTNLLALGEDAPQLL